MQGTTSRLLVIGGRFVAATRITVPCVVGDGTHRIEELIQAMNRDPMRNGIHLQQLVVDADLRACLARSGHMLADVPEAGREIALRTAANASLGGVTTNVTDQVHVSHRELAERAAQAIGLSIAGIDVVSLDISRPCAQVGTRIIEVNARPGLDLHVFPRHGRARDVGGAMIGTDVSTWRHRPIRPLWCWDDAAPAPSRASSMHNCASAAKRQAW